MKKLTLSGARGFTLIELLVVVLIIGILATVALPQYIYTVKASRVKSKLPMLRALLDAQQRHFLATGAGTTDLEQLDTRFDYNSSEDMTADVRKYNTDWGWFAIRKDATMPVTAVHAMVGDITIAIYDPPYTNYGESFRGSCYGSNAEAEKTCSKIGHFLYTTGSINVYTID